MKTFFRKNCLLNRTESRFRFPLNKIPRIIVQSTLYYLFLLIQNNVEKQFIYVFR